MAAITIVTLLPQLLDLNGDGGNARVLAARARWAGLDVAEVPLAAGDPFPANASIIVIGSSSDDALTEVIAALAEWRPALSAAIDAGVPVLAVGTGWEAIASQIETEGEMLEGLSLVPGRAMTVNPRISGELVVDSSAGRLVGYQNQSRRMLVPQDLAALGTVRFGVGNEGSSGEGLRYRSVIATRMHGPILAKNPLLADEILSTAALLAGADYAVGTGAADVDAYAAAARSRILAKLEISH